MLLVSVWNGTSMKAPQKGREISPAASPSRVKMSLNESLSEKEGKSVRVVAGVEHIAPSMKVPARRRRNAGAFETDRPRRCLNESPSKKEGKFR